MPPAHPTAFVTGATGFLGLNLIEQLSAQGWQVWAMHRASSNLDALRAFDVQLVQADLSDPPSLARALPERVDALFHVAANTSMWDGHRAQQWQENVVGTDHILEVAVQNKAKRLVLTSTWGTFEGSMQMTEDSPQVGPDAWRHYDRTKYISEQRALKARERGLDVVILHPPHIIGRYDWGNWSRMIRMVHERSLPGIPPGRGDFAHAQEVAKAHIRAALHTAPSQRYLLGGAHASFAQVFAQIAALTDRPLPRALPAVAMRAVAQLNALRARFTNQEPALTPQGAAAVIAKRHVISDLAERELEYVRAPLDVMIEDAWRWMRDEGMLT